ncbi:hypothetical protein D3C73_836280 [compost metagenome]
MILKSGYVVDGLGLVPRIKGIYRDASDRRERWVVSPTNDNTLEERAYFHDNTYGGAHAAYKAAVQHLYHHGELFSQGMRRMIKERQDKQWKTGTVGVCVRVQHRGTLDYYTIIAAPIAEQGGCIVYAGNEHTREKYFAAAMTLCKDHRENAVHLYMKKRRVKLKDAMPWHVAGIM